MKRDTIKKIQTLIEGMPEDHEVRPGKENACKVIKVPGRVEIQRERALTTGRGLVDIYLGRNFESGDLAYALVTETSEISHSPEDRKVSQFGGPVSELSLLDLYRISRHVENAARDLSPEPIVA